MKSAFLFPARLFAFWLLFFALFRLWFVLWFSGLWSDGSSIAVWASFYHAIPLDMSMAGYFVLAPVLAWFVGLALRARGRKAVESFVFWFNVLIFSVFIFVFGANVFIYEEWHTLLNNRAIEYFKTPAALLDSMSLPFIVGCILLYLSVIWLFYRVYLWVVGRQLFAEKASGKGWLLFPVWLPALLLAIRGGLGVMPINESEVYYSPHIFYNHAATNTAWHLIHSIIETRSTENHFVYMDQAEAERLKAQLFEQQGDAAKAKSPVVAADSTPFNLVCIIMESQTAQVLEPLGGEKGVCPNLERLASEGILFAHCYGSGYRTDQGLVSVLAGYPAQPDQSIVLLEDKASALSSIPQILKNKGYATAFFYGGELTFANIGSWLTQQRFEHIVSEKDFDSAEKTQRWGVDDEKLLQRAVQDISNLPQPFFATALTLSLHPPYDVPFQSNWKGDTDREKFLNSAAFADHAIGRFFEAAAGRPWFDHTLFVFVADHGASQPNGVGLDNPISRQIPWIITGKPLISAWKGKKMESFCNHHDIPATVLHLLGQPVGLQEFPWSHDRLLPTQPGRDADSFAYFTNENGIGWINGRGKGFYYFGENNWKQWDGTLDVSARQTAKAYLQTLYADFLKR